MQLRCRLSRPSLRCDAWHGGDGRLSCNTCRHSSQHEAQNNRADQNYGVQPRCCRQPEGCLGTNFLHALTFMLKHDGQTYSHGRQSSNPCCAPSVDENSPRRKHIRKFSRIGQIIRLRMNDFVSELSKSLFLIDSISASFHHCPASGDTTHADATVFHGEHICLAKSSMSIETATSWSDRVRLPYQPASRLARSQ